MKPYSSHQSSEAPTPATYPGKKAYSGMSLCVCVCVCVCASVCVWLCMKSDAESVAGGTQWFKRPGLLLRQCEQCPCSGWPLQGTEYVACSSCCRLCMTYSTICTHRPLSHVDVLPYFGNLATSLGKLATRDLDLHRFAITEPFVVIKPGS